MLLPVAALGWLLGLVAVDAWSAPPWMAGAWFGALIPLGFITAGRPGAVAIALASLLALFGGLRAQPPSLPAALVLEAYLGSPVELVGVIDSGADPGTTRATYRLKVERLIIGDQAEPAAAAILIRVNQYIEFLPGDRVRVRGVLEAPEAIDEFDYRAYVASRGAIATMFATTAELVRTPGGSSLGRETTRLRLRLESSLQRSLPEPEASLAAGIAFGRDDGLSREVRQQFRDAGLIHLTAVSGGNIVLIVALTFFAVQGLVSRRLAMPAAAIAILAYVAVAGASGSVIRAGVMASVFLAGEYLGKPQSGLAALAFAAITMTGVDPGLIHDVGFQLSLTSTAALITFGPRFRSAATWALSRVRLDGVVPGFALQAVVLSFAAGIGTLPVVMVTFGRVSLVGLVLNAVIEPVFAVAFYLSLATTAASLAWAPAGEMVGLAAYYPLAFITMVARVGAGLPGAAVDVPAASTGLALGLYAALALAGWFAYRRFPEDPPRAHRPKRSRELRWAARSAAGGALAIAVIAISLAPMNGSGRLTVTFLDVDQGDSILVTTPHGQHVLIDSGPSGIGLARELGAVLPHWGRTIDIAILTHPQEDHIGGFPALLRRYRVGEVVDNGEPAGSLTARLLRGEVHSARSLYAGDRWQADSVTFEVLWPFRGEVAANSNNASIVLRITYGDRSFLLTGDIEGPAQRDLLANTDVRADVLKVPHHGSKTSDPTFFAAVRPAVAVVSSGAGNRFGHPASVTLDALAETAIARTDTNGRITISTNGTDLRVRLER